MELVLRFQFSSTVFLKREGDNLGKFSKFSALRARKKKTRETKNQGNKTFSSKTRENFSLVQWFLWIWFTLDRLVRTVDNNSQYLLNQQCYPLRKHKCQIACWIRKYNFQNGRTDRIWVTRNVSFCYISRICPSGRRVVRFTEFISKILAPHNDKHFSTEW